MKYTIITSSAAYKLSEQVTEMMTRGWICQGGVAIGGDNRVGYEYAQAMTKAPEKP